MKKIVCSAFGRIYDAQILSNGIMSSANRRECTDECIDAVVQHMLEMQNYKDRGEAGYEWTMKDGHGNLVLRLYDDSKFKLVPVSNKKEEE